MALSVYLLPDNDISIPYRRGMILQELIQKYEFDVIVPDLLSIDEPVQDNPYAFKEAFNEPRRMAPEDADGKQIIVTITNNAKVIRGAIYEMAGEGIAIHTETTINTQISCGSSIALVPTEKRMSCVGRSFRKNWVRKAISRLDRG